MTTQNASEKLFEWFLENDSFCLDDDFLKLVIVSENEFGDRAAVVTALNEYKGVNLINNINIKEKEVWVLKRPLKDIPLTLQIMPFTASAISRIINTLTEDKLFLDKKYSCDPLNIKEQDILLLLQIIDRFIDIATSEYQDTQTPPESESENKNE